LWKREIITNSPSHCLNIAGKTHSSETITPRKLTRTNGRYDEEKLENGGNDRNDDEFFIRLNSTPAGGPSGFSQNRVFAGLGLTFNQYFQAEGGYLNQYLNSVTSANNIMHHLVLGSLFINF
jgi:hypothetical protein